MKKNLSGNQSKNSIADWSVCNLREKTTKIPQFFKYIEIISMKGCVTIEQNFAEIPGKFLF